MAGLPRRIARQLPRNLDLQKIGGDDGAGLSKEQILRLIERAAQEDEDNDRNRDRDGGGDGGGYPSRNLRMLPTSLNRTALTQTDWRGRQIGRERTGEYERRSDNLFLTDREKFQKRELRDFWDALMEGKIRLRGQDEEDRNRGRTGPERERRERPHIPSRNIPHFAIGWSNFRRQAENEDFLGLYNRVRNMPDPQQFIRDIAAHDRLNPLIRGPQGANLRQYFEEHPDAAEWLVNWINERSQRLARA